MPFRQSPPNYHIRKERSWRDPEAWAASLCPPKALHFQMGTTGAVASLHMWMFGATAGDNTRSLPRCCWPGVAPNGPPRRRAPDLFIFYGSCLLGCACQGKKKSHTQGVVPFPSPWMEAAASHPESPGRELEVRSSSCALSRAGQCLSFFLRLLQAGDVVATKGD